ncbi:MAG: hypothetical protein CMH12_12420 [Maritimibacter sp.]|nr:hypothetical protein [Maritimibacter sp.]
MRLLPVIALGGLVAVGVLAWALNAHRIAKLREAQTEARAALMSDPVVAGLLERGNARCPQAEEAFVWACGVVLRFDAPVPGGLCSSPDQPRFAGRLDLGDGGPPEDMVWYGRYRLPLTGLLPCQGSECGDVTVIGAAREDAGFGQRQIPTEIGPNPVWPDFEDRGTYGTWQDGAWGVHDGGPVFFHFGQGRLGGLEGYGPPISMTSFHPSLPLLVSLTLPFGQKDGWRQHMSHLFDELEQRVVRREIADTCVPDASAVRFTLNPYRQDWLRRIKVWAEAQGG